MCECGARRPLCAPGAERVPRSLIRKRLSELVELDTDRCSNSSAWAIAADRAGTLRRRRPPCAPQALVTQTLAESGAMRPSIESAWMSALCRGAPKGHGRRLDPLVQEKAANGLEVEAASLAWYTDQWRPAMLGGGLWSGARAPALRLLPCSEVWWRLRRAPQRQVGAIPAVIGAGCPIPGCLPCTTAR